MKVTHVEIKACDGRVHDGNTGLPGISIGAQMVFDLFVCRFVYTVVCSFVLLILQYSKDLELFELSQLPEQSIVVHSHLYRI